MFELVLILCALLSGVLVVVVLLQASKGGGLAGIAGGSQQIGTMFGTRRTADFLSKATWYIGAILLVLTLLVNLFLLPKGEDSRENQRIENILKAPQGATTTPPNAPKQ